MYASETLVQLQACAIVQLLLFGVVYVCCATARHRGNGRGTALSIRTARPLHCTASRYAGTDRDRFIISSAQGTDRPQYMLRLRRARYCIVTRRLSGRPTCTLDAKCATICTMDVAAGASLIAQRRGRHGMGRIQWTGEGQTVFECRHPVCWSRGGATERGACMRARLRHGTSCGCGVAERGHRIWVHVPLNSEGLAGAGSGYRCRGRLSLASLAVAASRQDAALLPERQSNNAVPRRTRWRDSLCARCLGLAVSVEVLVLGSQPKAQACRCAGAQVAVDAPGASIAPSALWSSAAGRLQLLITSTTALLHRDHCGTPYRCQNRRVPCAVAPHVHPPARSLDEAAPVLVRLLRQQPALDPKAVRARTALHRAAALRASRPARAPPSEDDEEWERHYRSPWIHRELCELAIHPVQRHGAAFWTRLSRDGADAPGPLPPPPVRRRHFVSYRIRRFVCLLTASAHWAPLAPRWCRRASTSRLPSPPGLSMSPLAARQCLFSPPQLQCKAA
jgi:hypothetical protein